MFRNLTATIVGFGWPFAIAGLAWGGILDVSLVAGIVVGFLIGAALGIVRLMQLYRDAGTVRGSVSIHQTAALRGAAARSALSGLGFVAALLSLVIWGIVALVR